MEYGKKVWIFADGDMPPRGESHMATRRFRSQIAAMPTRISG